MTNNWNDLQFFLAVSETRTLVGAARKLKVDETTAGRRLAALEADLGTKLFERKSKGYVLTAAGQKVLETALPIRNQLRKLSLEIEGGDQSMKGNVKLTLPETIATHLLIPRLPDFVSRYPELKLELIANSQTVNITKREADIAIRMFRPKAGTLYARKLGKLRFAFYSLQGTLEKRLISYPDSEATSAEVEILKKLRNKISFQFEVNNRYSMLAAIRAGLGFGMLPEILGNDEKNFCRLDDMPMIELDVWLVVHSDLKTNARVKATADFLSEILRERLR